MEKIDSEKVRLIARNDHGVLLDLSPWSLIWNMFLLQPYPVVTPGEHQKYVSLRGDAKIYLIVDGVEYELEPPPDYDS